MIGKTKNKKLFKIYLIFSLIAIIWIVWSSTHDITNWPRHHIVIKPGSGAAKYANSSDIGLYTKDFTTFIYFTSLSNFIFAFFTLGRVFFKNKFFSNNSQIIVSTYMVITLLVFWLGLSYLVPWSDVLFDFEQVFLHLINPILSVIIVIFFLDKNEKKIIMNKRTLTKSLIFPAIYYIFLWVFYLSISGKASVYPFTDFYKPFLYSSNIFIIILINITVFTFCLFLILLIYFILYKISNKKLKMFKNR